MPRSCSTPHAAAKYYSKPSAFFKPNTVSRRSSVGHTHFLATVLRPSHILLFDIVFFLMPELHGPYSASVSTSPHLPTPPVRISFPPSILILLIAAVGISGVIPHHQIKTDPGFLPWSDPEGAGFRQTSYRLLKVLSPIVGTDGYGSVLAGRNVAGIRQLESPQRPRREFRLHLTTK